jgi:hypothetical protein
MQALMHVQPAESPVADVVVVCPDPLVWEYRSPLQSICRVATTTSPEVAITYLTRTRSSVLIVDADSQDGHLGQRARDLISDPPAVLITLSEPDGAGPLLNECDSILIKPFAPNLLSTRVARLLRLQRSRELRARSSEILGRLQGQRARVEHLREHKAAGTLIDWPDEECPYCNHPGIVLIDYASMRRGWYGCRLCGKVWMARRFD